MGRQDGFQQPSPRPVELPRLSDRHLLPHQDPQHRQLGHPGGFKWWNTPLLSSSNLVPLPRLLPREEQQVLRLGRRRRPDQRRQLARLRLGRGDNRWIQAKITLISPKLQFPRVTLCDFKVTCPLADRYSHPLCKFRCERSGTRSRTTPCSASSWVCSGDSLHLSCQFGP